MAPTHQENKPHCIFVHQLAGPFGSCTLITGSLCCPEFHLLAIESSVADHVDVPSEPAQAHLACEYVPFRAFYLPEDRALSRIVIPAATTGVGGADRTTMGAPVNRSAIPAPVMRNGSDRSNGPAVIDSMA